MYNINNQHLKGNRQINVYNLFLSGMLPTFAKYEKKEVL